MTMHVTTAKTRAAVLDEAHVGHIRGALGTILHHYTGPRRNWKHRLQTLLAIVSPGLIVMEGDNDAGAFGTYTQAGQNYGTSLLWTLLLLIPVLCAVSRDNHYRKRPELRLVVPRTLARLTAADAGRNPLPVFMKR